ncbi:hypothetical protein [Criibacterium bergeronii]|uniref:GNAT family N-acetyltransferase n=1 Tax=Criibacterium bergeronii TaxID=1871336 RepID=A0A371IN46_9FIRM|nr:hypothetical protein [Criibacterium bergeronii]MBS6062558.1 hypothetical protein [Peptostreptococcaceae bacterium]RDY21915.1 hypothetical protein BBG48_002255 [Criibacterium bergeronii]
MIQNNGYKIRNSSLKTFKQAINDVYRLLIELYSKFSEYKFVSEEQFFAIFYKLRHILVWDMVFLAYKDNKLAGFLISVPNLSDLTNSISLINLLKIFIYKKRPKEFIILYLGTGEKHLGIGGAFAQLSKEYLQEHNCTGIGALIHENKSGSYYKNLIVDRYDYILMKLDL